MFAPRQPSVRLFDYQVVANPGEAVVGDAHAGEIAEPAGHLTDAVFYANGFSFLSLDLFWAGL